MRRSEGEKTLFGEFVELRPHDRRNYEIYGRWYSDPEVWYLTSWTSEPLRPREVERLFEDREASTTERSFAVHRKSEREPLGVISLMNISKAHASADLSIIVGHADDRSQGHGSDAIRTILGHAFETLGLRRVGLSVFDFNETAIETYERLGFREEGRLRDAVKRDGNFHDAILMSVLASEWRDRE